MPFDDPTARPDVEVVNREELAVIDRMLALLRTPRAWVKGHQHWHGRYCLIGAFRKARWDNPNAGFVTELEPVWCALERVVAGNPVLFNDRETTHHRDIIRALRLTRASFE